MTLLLRLFVCVCLLTALPAWTGPERIRVIFLNPTEEGNGFWGLVTEVAQDAAKDLGLELTVLYTHENRVRHRELITRIAHMQPLPDYVMMIIEPQSGLEAMKRLDALGIQVVVFNTPPLPDARGLLDGPGGRFSHWLLTTGPDDEQVGEQMARLLLAQMPAGDMVAIAGRHKEEASDARVRGLRRALQNSATPLRQVLFSDWNFKDGWFKTRGLLSRYTALTALWCAADRIAEGAVKAIEEAHKSPGKDLLVSGVDWTRAGLQLVASGKLTVDMGGHLFEPAWVLAMIYDHAQGLPLPIAADSRYLLANISAEQARRLLMVLDTGSWRQVDFAQFSRAHNPAGHQCFMNVECMLAQVLATAPVAQP